MQRTLSPFPPQGRSNRPTPVAATAAHGGAHGGRIKKKIQAAGVRGRRVWLGWSGDRADEASWRRLATGFGLGFKTLITWARSRPGSGIGPEPGLGSKSCNSGSGLVPDGLREWWIYNDDNEGSIGRIIINFNRRIKMLLNLVGEYGVLDFHPKCKRVKLTHICFVDDLLVFTKGHVGTVLAVKGIMDSIAECIGFHVGALPVHYLGVPLVFRRLSYSDCEGLMRKIVRRICSWPSKYLSFAGRPQLIQACVSLERLGWFAKGVFALAGPVEKIIWGGLFVPMHSFISWLALLDRLLTKEMNDGLHGASPKGIESMVSRIKSIVMLRLKGCIQGRSLVLAAEWDLL
ncbi:hypothetical protein F3Y22_tig00110163pilonHSYRG00024 [Hibiscus syriacus]|uniref:Reverse transcriptase domain-containing protein n=1 Tax=Hibiscus syriacus TaxID=106335 RepID=A0A6A3BHH6_HIBSY|nr:hypothetical protein F3Y22_tig00110163pilonHSYRG00024 [Hibiscus syriacus]